MASVEKAVKFSGKVKVEVIKKDKVPLFLKERDAKLTQEKIDFLKEELSKKCKSTRVICANNSLKVNL